MLWNSVLAVFRASTTVSGTLSGPGKSIPIFYHLVDVFLNPLRFTYACKIQMPWLKRRSTLKSCIFPRRKVRTNAKGLVRKKYTELPFATLCPVSELKSQRNILTFGRPLSLEKYYGALPHHSIIPLTCPYKLRK